MRAYHLRCEYKANPLGIDTLAPRLTWRLDSDERGAVQTAYEIVAANSTAELLDEKLIWDTGKTIGDSSIQHPYAGPALQARQRVYWRVRVWDGHDQVSAWSDPAYWEMGLLSSEDWKANWISPDWDEDISTSQPSPMLRTEFNVEGKVRSARLYVTSLGLYEASLNGRRVGDWEFTPGWTTYTKHIQYQTYDVTEHIAGGPNAIGAVLGDGWYRGRLGWKDRRNLYGDRLALLLQLHIDYDDGRTEIVVSDEGWRAATGPILASDIYDGETYDARLVHSGWDLAGFDAGEWKGVRLVDQDKSVLVAQYGPPVRAVEEIQPVALSTAPSGETIVDFGQIMTGWVRLQVTGPAGTEITVRHAEVLEPDGNLYITNLRTAKATDRYILAGGGEEVLKPHFTFHGFRYVGISGWPGALDAANVVGVVLHSDMVRTGEFATSNPLINQLQHNIVWGQRGNFLDVPTDCPQRDERLGWTGDAQIFARTASFNYDVAAFFTKWLATLADDQYPNGAVPWVVPDVLKGVDVIVPGTPTAGATGWGDAMTVIPWLLYQVYGDERILADRYENMVAWIEYMHQQEPEELRFGTGFHFGDWVALDTMVDGNVFGATDVELIGTAYFAYSTDIVAKTAKVLGRQADARKYEDLYRRIVAYFQREFLTPSGRLASNTQTAYILALTFDLLPEAQRAEAARRLVENIRERGTQLVTGFLGTPYLCYALSRNGYLDVAYELLLREEYPSWLFPVKQGATTIWERWDGIKADGSFQTPSMNSFNHYAYGAIGEWMVRFVAGLDVDPAYPGFVRAIVAPKLGGGFSSAQASFESIIGAYAVDWKLADGIMHLSVTAPANGGVEVHLAGAVLAQVTEGGRALTAAPDIREAHQTEEGVQLKVGAGHYTFTYPSK